MELMDNLKDLQRVLVNKIADIQSEMKEYGFEGEVFINNDTVKSLGFVTDRFILCTKTGGNVPLLDCDMPTKVAMFRHVKSLYGQLRADIKLKIKELKAALKG